MPEEDIRNTNNIFSVLETIKVNSLQMACAQIIHHLTASFKHQLHIIPGGYGKSRVAGVSTLLALKTNSFTKVHLVYSTKRLMEKDQTELYELFNVSKIDDKVVFHADLNFEVGIEE